jgi:predicted dinucleotide-binding enzyme
MTIVGSGRMARGIATRLLAGGSSVSFAARDAEAVTALAGKLLGAAPRGASVEVIPFGEANGGGVCLAVPYAAVASVLDAYGPQLAGTVLVDITNPVDWSSFDSLVTPPGTSAAEEIARLVPAARVVKAFNTTFAGPLAAGERLDVLLAGDDEDAKASVAELVEAAPALRPLDVGPLRRARELEALQLLHITAQERLGSNWMSAVSFVLPDDR